MSKIQKLHIFFSLVFSDMSTEEREYLDEKLIEVYAGKGISFDNESLYSNELSPTFTLERKFKSMPILGDLYDILEADPKTRRLALLLKRLVKGSLKAFNQQTNVDLNNKYTVADISELKSDLLPIGMFIVVDLFWDKIKEDRTQKKKVLKLSDDEMAKVTTFARGHGLFYAGANHIAIEFRADKAEPSLITTNREELRQIKKQRLVVQSLEEGDEENVEINV